MGHTTATEHSSSRSATPCHNRAHRARRDRDETQRSAETRRCSERYTRQGCSSLGAKTHGQPGYRHTTSLAVPRAPGRRLVLAPPRREARASRSPSVGLSPTATPVVLTCGHVEHAFASLPPVCTVADTMPVHCNQMTGIVVRPWLEATPAGGVRGTRTGSRTRLSPRLGATQPAALHRTLLA